MHKITKKAGIEPRKSLTRQIRYLCLLAANVYIIAHVTLWYAFDFQPWGKTAMTGVPALIRGNINPAAVMVFVILVSVFVFGRGFCGWACHIRGVIELSDWVMRKLKVSRYMKLRDRNVLLNTRYPWLMRIGALFILLMPVTVYLKNHDFRLMVDMTSPPPWADLPGFDGLLFNASAPVNMVISTAMLDITLIIFITLLIIFTATFVFNFFYGQGAFCRIICPYAALLGVFLNLSPFQRKITRVDQCQGCRKCSSVCPQGIDVSREIFHNNGKVKNRDCIKCFSCVYSCDDNVLKDTAALAVPQITPRPEYERRPWLNESKDVQVIDPISAFMDFVSMVAALFLGAMASRFGGFWFFVGVIVGFLAIRLFFRLVQSLYEKRKTATVG